jgi:hypothetical protein
LNRFQQIRQLNLSQTEKEALQTKYRETDNRHWQERIQYVLLKGQGSPSKSFRIKSIPLVNGLRGFMKSFSTMVLEILKFS